MLKIITICIACIATFNSITMGQTQGDDCNWPFNATLGSNSFDTSNATSSSPLPDDSMCAGTSLDWGKANQDIWFKFNPSSDGSYNFTTCDSSSYDTSMVLYKTDCSNQVACNGDWSGDDGCQPYYSTIEFTLTAGANYYIRIGGWQGESGQGTLTISEAGNGDLQGACCIDYGNGKSYCYESTRDDCIAEDGSWTKGAYCDEIMCGVVASSIYYVNVANTNPGNGLSWGTAFLDLQDALDVVGSGNQIWVAQGTYYPSELNGSSDPREATYRLIAGVEIYGGFVGNETDVHEREPYVNQVHLSGDLNNDDGGSGGNSENAYHVLLADNLTGLPPVLDGLFINGGNADGTAPHHSGGGLKVMNYSDDSTAIPRIFQSVFAYNNGINGGAIAVTGVNSGVTITRGLLVHNVASADGGAIRNGGITTLDNCLISANRAGGEGGAIYNNQESCILTNNTIVQNAARLGGCIYAVSGSISATNTILWGNETVIGSNSQVVLVKATFNGNYNCIQAHDGNIQGEGNINKNPRFTNELGNDGIARTGDENFRLFQQSPCIDAGDNTAVDNSIDIAGVTRQLDDPYTVDTGNNPSGLPIVDMGAYEHVAGNGGNGVLMWSGNNSSYFYDPENWLPGGYPSSDSDVLFNGSSTNKMFVLLDQTSYLNSLHVTGGVFKFDLNENNLILRGASQALSIDPYSNDASIVFQGPGLLNALNPIELGGNAKFENMTLSVSELVMEEGSVLSFDGTMIGSIINEGSRIRTAGGGTGSFTITGELINQGDGPSSGRLVGSIAFDIAGRISGDTYDKLIIDGSTDMSTAIELRWNREFNPVSADVFDILDLASISGSPTVIFNRGLPSNLLCRWFTPQPGVRGSGDEVVVETTGPIVFDSGTTLAITNNPSEIVVADLDGINGVDVAIAVPDPNFGLGSVIVLLNNGTSGGVWQGFTEQASMQVGIEPIDIEVFDANNDGTANDLIVTNYFSNTVTIFTNDGDAGFTSIDVDIDSGPKYISVANYVEDGDSLDDIAVACDSALMSVILNSQSLLGTTFTHHSSLGIPTPADIQPGDVNNDKDFDHIILGKFNDSIRVIEGDGTGSYDSMIQIADSPIPTGSGATEISFANLNGDNLDDLITVNKTTGSISILLGDAGTGLVGGGALGNASTVSVGTDPTDIIVGDFDNDGDDDFVLSVIGDVSGERELLIVRNDTVTAIVLSTGDAAGSGSEPTLVQKGDFDDDGVMDLVSLIDLAPDGFTNSPAIAVFLNTTEVVVNCPADVNGDGSVSVNDLLELIAGWGSPDASLDLDGSGIVDVGDLLVIIAAWGPC